MPGGRPHLGREANGTQITGEMLGGRAAIILEGRIGGDRLDAKILKQPIDAAVKIGVDAGENAVEI
jgi:hypothetical protein